MFVEYSLSLAFVRKLSCRLLINYVLGEEDRENFITSDEDVNVIKHGHCASLFLVLRDGKTCTRQLVKGSTF